MTTLTPNNHLACKKENLPAFEIPPHYNRDVGPWEYRHLTNVTGPWLFTMEFHIYDVQEIDDEKLTITFDGYFKIKWMEPRSQINVSSATWRKGAMIIDNEEHYFIPFKYIDALWIPAFEIHRLELYQPQRVLKEAANLKINETKFIRYIAKVKIVLSCTMTFDNYPFDSHTCLNQVASFDYPTDIWDCISSVHVYDSHQRSHQYNIDIVDIPRNESIVEQNLNGLAWNTRGFKIKLTRKKGQIFLQVYLTSGMLVVLACMSFIVPPDVVPGRMGLLVTVFFDANKHIDLC